LVKTGTKHFHFTNSGHNQVQLTIAAINQEKAILVKTGIKHFHLRNPGYYCSYYYLGST